MALRLLPSATVGMQRAGALVAAAVAASETRLVPLERYSATFLDLLRHKVPVDDGHQSEVGAYLRGLALWKRYGAQSRTEVPSHVEIQDAWLSDPAMPSATGAVTPAAAGDLPSLAAGLRLVRAGNHTLTARGRLLRLLGADATASIAGHSWRPNPLIVTPGLGLALLYLLLDADGDLVRAAYGSAAQASAVAFTRYDFAVHHVVQGCDDLRRQLTRRGLSGANVAQARQLADLRDAILKTDRTRAKSLTWGGGRPPDQAATVRLEPYVDLGLLTKDDRFSYTYRLTPGQQQFFVSLTSARDVGDVLDHGLAGAYLRARGVEAAAPLSPDEVWERLAAAYRDLRSAMGYASFHEVVLLALGRLIDEGNGRCFEVGDGVDVIRERHRLEPATVQFTVTRGGALRYMRIKEARANR
jgi:hypothetical protein